MPRLERCASLGETCRRVLAPGLRTGGRVASGLPRDVARRGAHGLLVAPIGAMLQCPLTSINGHVNMNRKYVRLGCATQGACIGEMRGMSRCGAADRRRLPR